jgi:hypothetical protein
LATAANHNDVEQFAQCLDALVSADERVVHTDEFRKGVNGLFMHIWLHLGPGSRIMDWLCTVAGRHVAFAEELLVEFSRLNMERSRQVCQPMVDVATVTVEALRRQRVNSAGSRMPAIEVWCLDRVTCDYGNYSPDSYKHSLALYDTHLAHSCHAIMTRRGWWRAAPVWATMMSGDCCGTLRTIWKRVSGACGA